MRKIWEYFDIFLRLENERREPPHPPDPQRPTPLHPCIPLRVGRAKEENIRRTRKQGSVSARVWYRD